MCCTGSMSRCDYEYGIWRSNHTIPNRLEAEWPRSAFNQIYPVTRKVAESLDAQNDLRPPIILDIGPSCLYGSFPELETLLKTADPKKTEILAIDYSSRVIENLKDYKPQLVIPFLGNGWKFLEVLGEHGADIGDIKGTVALIIASNNLGFSIEELRKREAFDEIDELISNFLVSAQKILQPDGEIILSVDRSILHLKAAGKDVGKCSIVEDGYKELILPDGNSNYWSSFIKYLALDETSVHQNKRPILVNMYCDISSD